MKMTVTFMCTSPFVGPTVAALPPFIGLVFQDDREMEAQKQEASDEAWRRRRVMVA
ncbi:hypothetical protein [Micrococcus luteus]|uniref:hypothetical protein n=2 Tax=Micrococcus TaxID=1269 RepID=UPI001E43BB3E|nr:hypothetical protein [Micrococcus luteus]MCD0180180.1 hypothetical protein [Micrococcus luteus]MCM3481428.1 hypothetical protein [Micrococcus luteus]MCV7449633.1 hypothetical protein [Micrococcus luteus]MCV7597886.1 hypothetical protein [Micrococcus luteus]MCV7640975.1 hypothetical protein [Micrococcus luteus]